ncbi:MAG: universal stress protein [Chitinophagaceae bacterium]|nr:universal stress protein [Chitinophagaceae bacterium]
MNTIIVPTDFSPAALNALNYAADMAIEINADIHLLHIYQVPIAIIDAPLVLVSVDELKEGAEQQLASLKQGLEHVTSGKIKISTEAILGDPIDELQKVCERVHPFAVVMGSLGHSSLERSLFGSTTLSAIRHITYPVIAVPIGKEYSPGIKKAGLAADLRAVAQTTPFEAIQKFIQKFNAELHVLNVAYKETQSQEEKDKELLVMKNALKDLNPQFHFIENSDVEQGIEDFAVNNNLDLIIAIPKKHKLLDGIFKKSSTRQLIYESSLPVMCIHEEM